VTTGIHPNMSAYNRRVIIAVLKNIAVNSEIVTPIVSLVIVVYLENLPSDLSNILSIKFTIIITKAVAILIIVIDTYYI